MSAYACTVVCTELSCSVMSDSLWPHGLVALQAPLSIRILQARILEWVAIPSSRASFQPRDRTQASCIAGGFFTVWATRDAHEFWSGYPIPSPGDLPNPGVKLGSPTLQADYQLSYPGSSYISEPDTFQMPLHPGSLPPPKHTLRETDLCDTNHWAALNSGCQLHLAVGEHWPETGRRQERKGVLFISLLLPCQVPMDWLYSGHKARAHHKFLSTRLVLGSDNHSFLSPIKLGGSKASCLLMLPTSGYCSVPTLTLCKSSLHIFKNFLFCIGVKPINNVVIVSGEQQRDSAIHIHVSILSQTPLPSRLPHNIEQSSLCSTVGPCWLSILNIVACTRPSQTP